MHPRIQELLNHIDANYDKLLATLDTIPADFERVRPAEDQWSVAGVVQHLAIVENRIADALKARLDTARAEGLGPETETSSVMTTLDVSRLLNRTKKFMASEAAHPSPDVELRNARGELSVAHEKFRDLLLSADGLSLSQVVHPHIFLGPFTFYQWAVFVGAHEGRHLLQIHEIVERLQFSPSH